MEENVKHWGLKLLHWLCLLKIKNSFIFPSQEPSLLEENTPTRPSPSSDVPELTQIQQPEARVSLRFPVTTQKIHIKPHNDAISCLVLTLPTEICDFSLTFTKLSYRQTPSFNDMR